MTLLSRQPPAGKVLVLFLVKDPGLCFILKRFLVVVFFLFFFLITVCGCTFFYFQWSKA